MTTEKMSIIDQLKTNEKPLCLLSSQMQDFILGCKADDLEYLSSNRSHRNPDWRINANTPGEIKRSPTDTYRLRADYTEEPEIVECEITLNPESNIWGYKCPCSGDPVNADLAHSCPGFRLIGFKFMDGTVMGSPVKYSVPGITSKGYYASYDDLKTKQALEHHATHVCFRRQK